MRDAMRRARRRPRADQPARSRSSSSSTTRCRSTSSARRRASDATPSCEFERNRERYAFLRWGQKAFRQLPRRAAGHRHRPPGEPRVPRAASSRRRDADGTAAVAYPDTLVGTDSHTTMINGLGVLGWGVGGIEAEAAMLGQPVSMLIPQVVGFRLTGTLPRGRDGDRPRAHRHPDAARRRASSASSSSSSAPGLAAPAARRPRDDRATWRPSTARPAASSRSTTETLALPAAHRPAATRRSRSSRPTPEGAGPLPRRRTRPSRRSPTRSSSTSATVEPSLAGPRRPQDRVPLREAQGVVRRGARHAAPRDPRRRPGSRDGPRPTRRRGDVGSGRRADGRRRPRTRVATARPTAASSRHGSVVIAAITSCTNTSNPSVMLAAGLLAKKAVERGLQRQAVGEDEPRARLARS